jgi:hypothetical protein
MMFIAEFTFDVPISDFHRDAARVRKILRMEAKDGNIPFVQFLNNCVCMLVMVVGDN